jgi:TP901 family phage tail tape measure protein
MADLNDIQLRIIVQGTGLDNLNRLNQSLASTMGAMNNAASSAQNATSKWSQFRDQLSTLEHRFDAVFRAASHLQALGSDLTGMGEATIGVLRGAVDAWGEYEFAIHRASGALSIFDTTSPIFFELQDAVNAAAQEVRLFPAEEIAKAVYYWGSATGQTVETHEDLQMVMSGLIPIMQTAAITETDYEAAIKGTYQIIQQYGLGLTRLATAQDVASGAATHVGQEMSNTADITQKLMMITQNTAVEYSDLIEAFKYTGAIAPALGVKYEDLLLILGRLGDMGIRAGGAGRALQQMFTQLLDPTVRAHKALEKAWENAYGLGNTFEEMVFPNGEFVGVSELVDQLAGATENLTERERGRLIGIITTQNEMRALVPLIEDQIRARREGISVYDDEKFALENAAEQFQQTVHLLEVSWKGTMGYLTATVGPVIRLIGAEVARVATPFVEQLGNMLKSVKAWLETHPEVVEWGVRLAAIAGIVLLVAGALFTAVGVLLAFGAGFAFVIKGAGIFFSIFNRFLPILGLITLGITSFITIWTNNMGGIQEAVANVIAAFQRLWDKLNIEGASGISVLEYLSQAIMPALEAVAWLVVRALEGLTWVLDRIAESPEAIKVVEALAQALGVIIAISFVGKMANMALSIATLGGSAKTTLIPLKYLFESLGKLASFSSLRHPVRAIGDVKAAIELAAEAAANKAKSIKDALFGIGPKAAAAAGTTRGAMAGMAAAVRGAATGISLSIKSVLIATGIGALIVAVTLLYEAWVNNWGDIQGKFAAVVAFLGQKFEEIKAWVVTTWQNITTAIRDGVTNMVTFITELPGKIWDAITTGFTNIATFLSEWWTSLGENTGERIGFIVGFVIALPIRILAEFLIKFAEIASMLLAWFDARITDFENWAVSVFNTVTTWFSQLPGKIGEFFSGVWNTVSTWFVKLIRDVGTWASSTLTSITTWLSQLPGKIASFFSTMYTNTSTWFINVFIPNIGTWASNAVTAVVDWFKELPGKVLGWVNNLIPKLGKFFRELPGNIWDAITGVGKAIVDGIWSGISGMWQTFWNNVMGFFNGIVNGVKSALGIKSPSTVFAEIGTQMIEGVTVGIEKNKSAVSAMESQVDSLLATGERLSAAQTEFSVQSAWSYDGNSERHLVLDVRVSSPDGTVNGATQTQLKDIFGGEEFISALEHMATVG